MAETENHYVLIIHGTFNPPAAAGEPEFWFQPQGQFSLDLGRQLAAAGPGWPEAVWRALPNGQPTFFSWSGANTHQAREEAGAALSRCLLEIWRQDPRARIHLIGHSHGGNVIIKALEQYGKALTAFETADTQAEKKRAETASVKAAEAEGDAAAVAAGGLPSTPAPTPEDEVEADQARFAARREQLGAAWGKRPVAEAPDLHRLGRVVFLGTPFFHKQWRRSAGELRRRQTLVGVLDVGGWLTFGVLMALVLAAFACYLPLLGLTAVLDLFGWGTFIGFNPLAWTGLAGWVVWGVAAVAVIFLALLLIGLLDDPRRKVAPANTNYYFDHVNVTWYVPGGEPRVPALVVNAGALDEALLALSSQPLLEAFGQPAVEAFTGFRLDVRPRPPEVGVPHDFEGAFQAVKAIWLRLSAVFLWPVFGALRLLVQRPSANWLMSVLRQVVVSSASGLPPHEVDDANLVVRNLPEVPALEAPEVWDVSEYLAYHRQDPRPVLDPERYRFFWDAAERERRFAASRIAAALQTRHVRPELLREAEFQRTCLAIEERLMELIGGVQVQHGRYYQDPPIVAGIARFLAEGVRPGRLTAAPTE